MNLLVTIGTTQENLTRESDLCGLVFHELFTPAPGEFLVCGQIARRSGPASFRIAPSKRDAYTKG